MSQIREAPKQCRRFGENSMWSAGIQWTTSKARYKRRSSYPSVLRAEALRAAVRTRCRGYQGENGYASNRARESRDPGTLPADRLVLQTWRNPQLRRLRLLHDLQARQSLHRSAPSLHEKAFRL